MRRMTPLTPAEIAVLRLIAAGNANKQIADQLSITEETVKSRVKSILSKLGANDRTHAAMIGREERDHRAVVGFCPPASSPDLHAKLERVTITTLFGVSMSVSNVTFWFVRKDACCAAYTPHSRAAGRAQVCFSCAWLQAPRFSYSRAPGCGATLPLPTLYRPHF